MNILTPLLRWLVAAEARHRERAAFRRLDARLLRDIGADPAGPDGWGAPPHWRRRERERSGRPCPAAACPAAARPAAACASADCVRGAA